MHMQEPTITPTKPKYTIVFPTQLSTIEYEFPECIVVINRLTHKAKRQSYLDAWEIALQTKERKCENCGALKPLEIHHIDGNAKNNASQNLKILCANCHMSGHGRS